MSELIAHHQYNSLRGGGTAVKEVKYKAHKLGRTPITFEKGPDGQVWLRLSPDTQIKPRGLRKIQPDEFNILTLRPGDVVSLRFKGRNITHTVCYLEDDPRNNLSQLKGLRAYNFF